MKLGFETSLVLCQHASLVSVASAVFGGDKPPADAPDNKHDVTAGAVSYEAAIGSINNLLKWG